MSSRARLRPAVLLLGGLLAAASVGCAPTDSGNDASNNPSGTTQSTPAGAPADPCADPPTVQPGVLTIATDSPAYDPWFSHNDPTNGKGFESAVAYAVAAKMGFARDAVTWTKVPFNSSYQ